MKSLLKHKQSASWLVEGKGRFPATAAGRPHVRRRFPTRTMNGSALFTTWSLYSSDGGMAIRVSPKRRQTLQKALGRPVADKHEDREISCRQKSFVVGDIKLEQALLAGLAIPFLMIIIVSSLMSNRAQ